MIGLSLIEYKNIIFSLLYDMATKYFFFFAFHLALCFFLLGLECLVVVVMFPPRARGRD